MGTNRQAPEPGGRTQKKPVGSEQGQHSISEIATHDFAGQRRADINGLTWKVYPKSLPEFLWSLKSKKENIFNTVHKPQLCEKGHNLCRNHFENYGPGLLHYCNPSYVSTL